MEIIKNNRGGMKLLYEGHMYTKKQQSRQKILWECSRRTLYSCKGRALTDLEIKKFEARGEHSHEPDFEAVEATKLYAKIREDIAAGAKPQQILDENLGGVDIAICERMGKREHVKRKMRYQRRKCELQNTEAAGITQNSESEKQSPINHGELATWAASMMAKRMKLDHATSITLLQEDVATPSQLLQHLCEQDEELVESLLRSVKLESGDASLSPLDKKASRCLNQMQMLYTMQKRSELCDITICLSSSGGKGTVTRTVIEAHKCVLATVSEKIRKFQDSVFKLEQDTNPEHLRHVLEFAYTAVMAGVLRFEMTELFLIAKLALGLGVDSCASYIIQERPDFLRELVSIKALKQPDSKTPADDELCGSALLKDLTANAMNGWVERVSSDFNLTDYSGICGSSGADCGTRSKKNDEISVVALDQHGSKTG